MTPFAGYDMPLQFQEGVLSEHRWTRQEAGAFDVSHMGPAFLRLSRPTGDPDADHQVLARIIEPLVSGDIASLRPGQVRYSVLLNEAGGMLDDLMIARPEDPQDGLYIVVNGAAKEADFALIRDAAGPAADLIRGDDGALIAIQGPSAAAVTSALFPGADALVFMTLSRFAFEGCACLVARSGYTGEDGFEVLVPPEAALALYERLLGDPRIKPIGLGARDSLRLEAGLPLYGHDADETVSPFEAALGFAVSKKRLAAGTLRGVGRLRAEADGKLQKLRVGLRFPSGAPAREGAVILDPDGQEVGRVTSGGFSPSLSCPIAMGFVPPHLSAPGTALQAVVRGKALGCAVTPMPFVPHRYVRKSKVGGDNAFHKGS
jgi:aminomethyltransferase